MHPYLSMHRPPSDSYDSKFHRENPESRAIDSETSSREIECDNVDYYADETSETGSKASDDQPIAQNQTQTLQMSDESMVMAYICELKPKLGALSVEKCVDRGVTPGPLFGKLKNGEEIVLPNGNVVKPDDVRDPDDPGPIFLGNSNEIPYEIDISCKNIIIS